MRNREGQSRGGSECLAASPPRSVRSRLFPPLRTLCFFSLRAPAAFLRFCFASHSLRDGVPTTPEDFLADDADDMSAYPPQSPDSGLDTGMDNDDMDEGRTPMIAKRKSFIQSQMNGGQTEPRLLSSLIASALKEEKFVADVVSGARPHDSHHQHSSVPTATEARTPSLYNRRSFRMGQAGAGASGYDSQVRLRSPPPLSSPLTASSCPPLRACLRACNHGGGFVSGKKKQLLRFPFPLHTALTRKRLLPAPLSGVFQDSTPGTARSTLPPSADGRRLPPTPGSRGTPAGGASLVPRRLNTDGMGGLEEEEELAMLAFVEAVAATEAGGIPEDESMDGSTPLMSSAAQMNGMGMDRPSTPTGAAQPRRSQSQQGQQPGNIPWANSPMSADWSVENTVLLPVRPPSRNRQGSSDALLSPHRGGGEGGEPLRRHISITSADMDSPDGPPPPTSGGGGGSQQASSPVKTKNNRTGSGNNGPAAQVRIIPSLFLGLNRIEMGAPQLSVHLLIAKLRAPGHWTHQARALIMPRSRFFDIFSSFSLCAPHSRHPARLPVRRPSSSNCRATTSLTTGT